MHIAVYSVNTTYLSLLISSMWPLYRMTQVIWQMEYM